MEGKWGRKGLRGETGRKHQAKLSGRAKDTVTRSALMILVSDHTNPPTPPQRSYLHSASSAASSSSYRQRQQQQTALARQPPLDLACYCSSGWTLALVSGIGSCRPAAFRALPGYSLSPEPCHSFAEHTYCFCVFHRACVYSPHPEL